MKMFKSLQRKFVIICTAIAAILLLVTYSLVYMIISNNQITRIETAVSEALRINIPGMTRPTPGNNEVMLVQVRDDTIYYYRFDFYTDEVRNEIIETMLNTTEHRFWVGNQYFYYDSVQTNNSVNYALYNCTDVYNMAINMLLTFACSFVAIIILVGGIAMLYAKRAVKPVQDAFDNQKALIANASHELKTPLTIIGTNLNLIENNNEPFDNSTNHYLNAVNEQVEKMNDMIVKMLELSSIDNNIQGITLESFNLSNLCTSLLLSFEANVFVKNIQLDSNITSDMIYCSDQKLIEKLFIILIDNAIKYTPNDGKINISLTKKKKNYVFEITNSGEGIAPDKIEHIFERFYRANERDNQGNSFGLGLSMAQKIVEALKGKIACESVYGATTTFTVHLPD